MKRVTLIITAVLTVLMLTACSSNKVVYESNTESQGGNKAWTVLIYMCGGDDESVNGDYSKKLDIDIYTLEDIIISLKKPNRDPRDDFDKPILKSDVLHIEDLKKGMELEGTVRNVVDFGAFIDIGIKNDGLVHISKITDRYIKHPSEVLSVGDIVTCYVDEVFLDKGKVALSLIKNE